jgi:uncharacterized protein (TIGR03067 family)
LKLRALAIVTIGLLIAADKKDGGKKAEDSLEGAWSFVSVTENGKPTELPPAEVRLIFTKDKVIMKFGDMENEMWAYTLNPSKKPAEIDVTFSFGPHKGYQGKGIYLIDGETLKICHSQEPGDARPKEFASKEGSKLVLAVLKRQKK